MKVICFAILLLLANSQANVTNTVNFRDTGIVAVIDAMGTCRASWAFAAASHYESAFLKWGTGYLNTTIDLSEQYILECSNAGDCSGGSVELALSFALANGMPAQADYAYTGSTTNYGIPLTNTVGASCTTIMGKQKKLNTTLYLNKFTNIAYSQLQTMLSNFPVVGLMAVDAAFMAYDGTQYPYNCTYNITSDLQVGQAVMMFGYDSNSNILIEASGLASWGGSAYSNTTFTGIGFGKISPLKSYCGLFRHVYQYWTSANNTNTTYTYYTHGWMMTGVGVGLAVALLTMI